MKTFATIVILAVSVTASIARPMNLPIGSRQVVLIASGQPKYSFPACRADIFINGQSGKIDSIKMKIGESEHVVPGEAIVTLSAPNISTIGFEAEKGGDGKIWISLTFEPKEKTEQKLRYHIAIVGDSYYQAAKTWEEVNGGSTRRHFKALHKNK